MLNLELRDLALAHEGAQAVANIHALLAGVQLLKRATSKAQCASANSRRRSGGALPA